MWNGKKQNKTVTFLNSGMCKNDNGVYSSISIHTWYAWNELKRPEDSNSSEGSQIKTAITIASQECNEPTEEI